jgi:DNA-binding transcriptional ArsR family regulator
MKQRNTPQERKNGQKDRCGVFSADELRVQQAKDAIPDAPLVEAISSAFKALSHPTRVRILRALSQGELCVCEISEAVELSVSATSHQLALLKGQRLVNSRSDGKLVHYSLSDRFVIALLDDCTQHLSEGGGH